MGRPRTLCQRHPVVREDLTNAALVWLELSYPEHGGPLTVREDELLPDVLDEVRCDARFVRLESKEKGWSAVWAPLPAMCTNSDINTEPQLMKAELSKLWHCIHMPMVIPHSTTKCNLTRDSKKHRPHIISSNTFLVEKGFIGDVKVQTSKNKSKCKMIEDDTSVTLEEDEY